jgi:hypothetical protein
MLKKQFVDDVLVQATYMSGDRYTIATALKLNPKMGVLLIAANTDAAAGNELKSFYEISGAARGRVELAMLDCGGGTAEQKKNRLSVFYKNAQKAPRPAWLKAKVEAAVKIQTATYGTKVITYQFGKDAHQAAISVNQQWESQPHKTKIETWLTNQGFLPSKKYVFLWCKAGSWRAEKAHHFTSILTWRLLQDHIARQASNRTPVAAGDAIGITTQPSLTAFWERSTWKAIFQARPSDPAPGRKEQLATWQVIASKYKGNVCSVGLRSGAMELPALMGIPTLYVEERSNQQAERMAKWIGKVPGFSRLRTDAAWGLGQQISWMNDTARYVNGRNMSNTEWDTQYSLNGVVRGVNLEAIKKRARGGSLARYDFVAEGDPPGKEPYASVDTTHQIAANRALMLDQIRRNQLAAHRTVEVPDPLNASKTITREVGFGARQEEIDAIVKWIKHH